MGILDLKSMDDDYAAAEASNFEELPAGTYQCRIVEAKPGAAKTSGNPMINWKLVVLSGEFRGRNIFKAMTITPNSLGIVKSDLQALKFAKQLSQLEAALPSFINQAVAVRRSANGQDNQGRPRFNTYFQELLDIPIGSDVDFAPPADGMGDGMPF